MAVAWSGSQTVVSRLTMRGSRRDTLSTQHKVSALLSHADLNPPGLSPSAIVCIKTFKAQLPDSWDAPSNGLLPPPMWEQQTRASLEAVVRRAVRPALGAVPATADVVLFADRAELLACLARDWSENRIGFCWWWRSLFPREEGRQLLLTTWTDMPESVPRALHHLAQAGQAVRIIGALSSQDARFIRDALIRVFGLSELKVAIELNVATAPEGKSGAQVQREPSWHPGVSEVKERPGSEGKPGAQIQHEPPWHRWAPEVQQGTLTVEQATLLAIGLMLHRASPVVRTSTFARAVALWCEAVTLSRTQASDIPHPVETQGEVAKTRTADVPRTLKGNRSKTEGHVVPQADQASVSTSKPMIRSVPDREPALPLLEKVSLEASADGQKPEAVLSPKKQSTPLSETTPAGELLSEYEIETQFGGVLYLINVGLFLELYGDFTNPLRPGIALSMWDFLALVGERLLGAEVVADPLWPLLAQLTGRTADEPPGHEFTPPQEWRLPPQWLKQWGHSGAWRWSWSEGRLRVRHPEGFVVLDRDAGHEPAAAELAAELSPYGEVGELLPNDELRPVQGETILARWLDWLMGYLHVRLAHAFGGSGEQAVASLLCRRRARVMMSDSRLDAVFSLQSHPVEIRMSGLDRDPGWVPAAGRYIAFHFE